MDPSKLLAYTNSLAAELALLSDAGYKQVLTIETIDGPPCAAIVALGATESAILRRIIAQMQDDPEYVAYRQSRIGSAQTNAVAAIAPDRN